MSTSIKRSMFSLLAAMFWICSLSAQTMRFRLVSPDSIAAVNVKVVNLNTEKSTISNADGAFEIEAKPDQMLVFPTENYEYKRYLVQEEDAKKRFVTIVLFPKAVLLDDVNVGNKSLNPEDLGLVEKGQKTYTPQERKFATAVSGSAVSLASNLVSGRFKMLRKQIKAEKNEALLSRLEYQFEESVYTQRLRIPRDYVKGFQYFCIEDEEVQTALNGKNKTRLLNRISQLALTYLELIAQEEKETGVKP